MTNLQIVQAWIRSEYSYDGVDDPLTVVDVEAIDEPGDKGEQAGDFWLRDEVTGQIVRVVDGAVQTVWRNW